jgi:NitT/TauT family transport system ATP-binding protein
MNKLFPLDIGMSRMLGIIKIIKENGNRMDLAKLAEESEIDIDSLLPLIEACDMLGFTKTKDSRITLTKEGESITVRNRSKIIKAKLEAIEPFKSTAEILSKKEMSSEELFDSLGTMGFVFHGEKQRNHEILKGLLVDWGVRTKLLRYDPENDTWSNSK